jgi:hypothetical protein
VGLGVSREDVQSRLNLITHLDTEMPVFAVPRQALPHIALCALHSAATVLSPPGLLVDRT